MRPRPLAIAGAGVLVALLAGWSLVALVSTDAATWRGMARLEMSPRAAVAAVQLILFASSVLLGVELVRMSVHRRRRTVHESTMTGLAAPAGLLLFGLVVSPGGPAVDVAPASTAIPAGTLVSPAVAVAVVERILRRRREQLREGMKPDVLSEEESATLSEVVRIARTHVEGTPPGDVESDVAPPVASLLAAVDRPLDVAHPEVEADGRPAEWRVVLRVLGHPVLENHSGARATFRKSRALELLVWLALNRDRSRRSAARTAMWEHDVSDSTFSTIVSDMRRALTEIAVPPDGSTWCPPTYSDEIVLSGLLVTDAELLAASLGRLRAGEANPRETADHLARVRDIPFAGTCYSWADLDGTTTRLVMSVVEAVREVARIALETGDHESLLIAATAGLRVMPGCEEFLEIQAHALPEIRSRGSLRRRDCSQRVVPTLGR